MMTREQMIDKVIRMFGFENEMTIWFCELAENKTVTDNTLSMALELLRFFNLTIELEDEV